MNIYEVLERLVDGPRLQPYEIDTAVRLIRQMRDLNALGTTARFLDPATHECARGGEYWPDSVRCRTCQATMPALPHLCSPRASSRWDMRGSTTITTCRICGKEM